MDGNATRFAEACRALVHAASTRPGELAEACRRLHGETHPAGATAAALEFVAYEWVDAQGYTTAERAVTAGAAPAAALDLARGLRHALWVVDASGGATATLRDLDTDACVEVVADAAELEPRSVVHGRVAPWAGGHRFVGAAGVYGPRGVIARAELHAAWRASRERDLADEMATLRGLFLRQREERAAFVAFFGADERTWASADAMESDLGGFAHHLAYVDRPASLGGRSRAQATRRAGPVDAQVVQLRLGPTLRGPGRPGAIFDDVEGIHFLPGWGEFRAWAAGETPPPPILDTYLADPGITRLPFRRAGALRALGAHLGIADQDLETLLDPFKPRDSRAVPSLFPSPGDDGA